MWHYTTLPVWREILASGELRPTCYSGLDKFRPTLWFSSNPIWEPTSSKRVGVRDEGGTYMMQRRLSMVEQHVLLGLVRIRAPLGQPLLTFSEWGRSVGAPREWLASVVQGGRELGGNPEEWRATFEAVPVVLCAGIQRWDGGVWR